jgi:hypothetical protein
MRLTWLLVIAAAAAGCYDPELRDCSISCGSAGDCAAGQVCGTDGFCASPEVAGTCRSRSAGAPDAGLAELHLTVQGPGEISEISGAFTCTGDCTYARAPGSTVTLVATGLEDHDLQRWTASCAAQGAQHADGICIVTIEPPVTAVGAKFK